MEKVLAASDGLSAHWRCGKNKIIMPCLSWYFSAGNPKCFSNINETAETPSSWALGRGHRQGYQGLSFCCLKSPPGGIWANSEKRPCCSKRMDESALCVTSLKKKKSKIQHRKWNQEILKCLQIKSYIIHTDYQQLSLSTFAIIKLEISIMSLSQSTFCHFTCHSDMFFSELK